MFLFFIWCFFSFKQYFAHLLLLLLLFYGLGPCLCCFDLLTSKLFPCASKNKTDQSEWLTHTVDHQGALQHHRSVDYWERLQTEVDPHRLTDETEATTNYLHHKILINDELIEFGDVIESLSWNWSATCVFIAVSCDLSLWLLSHVFSFLESPHFTNSSLFQSNQHFCICWSNDP